MGEGDEEERGGRSNKGRKVFPFWHHTSWGNSSSCSLSRLHVSPRARDKTSNSLADKWRHGGQISSTKMAQVGGCGVMIIQNLL